jgi:multiple sugar transport system substrate-binding protein
MEAIWSAGGEVVNKDGDVAIDSAAAKLGLRQLAEEPSDPQVDARTYQEDDSTRAFREGRVALMRNWPVAYRRIKEGGEKAPSGVDVSANFAVAALRTPSVLGGQDLAISADTKKPLAARALIEFLIDPKRQKKLFEKGGLAAVRTSVYQDPGVRAQRPYADILRKAVDKAEPRPITPHYAVFSEAFRRVVNEALDNGGNLPSDAVRVLSDALQGYIR